MTLGRQPEFHALLDDGVRQFQRERRLTTLKEAEEEICRQLSVSVRTLRRWRAGENRPTTPDELMRLARFLMHEVKALSIEWLIQLFQATGNTIYVEQALAQTMLLPNRVQPQDATIPAQANTHTNDYLLPDYFPNLGYQRLIGRDMWCSRILDVLGEEGGNNLVGIDGLGGSGKTALALEVARLCAGRQLFSYFVWVRTMPTSDGQPYMDLESILNEIGTQLGIIEFAGLRSLQAKKNHLRLLLRNQRVLIVLDNLETALVSQAEIVHELSPLLSPSKLLMTSRNRFENPDVWTLNLRGLPAQEAKHYLGEMLSRIQVDNSNGRSLTIEEGDRDAIISITGGSPLAMNLVCGHLRFMPVHVVLQHLAEVKALNENTDEDDYLHFYRTIYMTSWRSLSPTGQQLLISMAQFIPGIGDTADIIAEVSGLEQDFIYRYLSELWQHSLIELSLEHPTNSLVRYRYFLHPLTEYFVRSDLVNSDTQ